MNRYVKAVIISLCLLLSLCGGAAWAKVGTGDTAEGRYLKKYGDLYEKLNRFRNRAFEGDAYSQFVLASFYYTGYGNVIEVDFKKAGIWYRKAAERGHSGAQYVMGNCCYFGECGVEKDYFKAVEWYRKSAAQGYEDAISALKSLDEY